MYFTTGIVEALALSRLFSHSGRILFYCFELDMKLGNWLTIVKILDWKGCSSHYGTCVRFSLNDVGPTQPNLNFNSVREMLGPWTKRNNLICMVHISFSLRSKNCKPSYQAVSSKLGKRISSEPAQLYSPRWMPCGYKVER